MPPDTTRHQPLFIPAFPGDDPIHTAMRAFHAERVAPDDWAGITRAAVLVRQNTGTATGLASGLVCFEMDIPDTIAGDTFAVVGNLQIQLRANPTLIVDSFPDNVWGVPEALLLSTEVQIAGHSCDNPDHGHPTGIDAVTEERLVWCVNAAARRVVLTHRRGELHEGDIDDTANNDKIERVGPFQCIPPMLLEALILIRNAWTRYRPEPGTPA